MISQDHSHDSSQDLENTLTIHESDHEGHYREANFVDFVQSNVHYYCPPHSLAGFLARAPRQRFQVPPCGAKGPVAVLSTSLWVKSSQVPTLHRKILSDLEIDLKTAETPSLMELLLG